MTDPTPDAARIAVLLTEQQKAALLGEGGAAGILSLVKDDLADGMTFGFRAKKIDGKLVDQGKPTLVASLTPLGLAVRAHLAAQDRPTQMAGRTAEAGPWFDELLAAQDPRP